MFKITGGFVISSGKTEKTNIYIKDGKIQHVTNEELPYTESVDATGKYVSAGFIDTHVHGGGGSDFMDGGLDAMRVAAKAHLKKGTTTIVPTTLACPYKDLLEAVKDFKKLLPESGKSGMPNLAGLHLEGPYFSPMQAGAQNPDCIYPPKKEEYEELIKTAEGSILKWSFAPELDGALEFCERISSVGISASIGHSNATYNDVLAAYNCGANSMTHFYSGMSTITRAGGFRVPGVVEAGYLLSDMWIELIADGCHLPPEILKMIFKNRGMEKCLLVTDAMRGADMPEGDSILGRLKGGSACIIEGGVAKMPDRESFAGSVATTDRLIRTLYKNNITTLEDAVSMITEKPAMALGLQTKGIIKEGYDADIVIFDDNINIDSVIVNGSIIHP